jgi:hypothetical protein
MAWDDFEGSGPGGAWLVGDNFGDVEINLIRANFAKLSSLQYEGTGTPEGVVTAPVGSTFRRTNGAAGTSLYIKESGVSNTGWRAVETTPTVSVVAATVSLTDAQIKALPTTPITIVSAPAAGYRNKLIGASLRLTSTSGAYTNIDTADAYIAFFLDTVRVSSYIYNLTAGSVTKLTDFLGAAHIKVADMIPLVDQAVSAMGSVATLEAEALVLKVYNNAAGVLTGGNAANTLKATAYYAVEAL